MNAAPDYEPTGEWEVYGEWDRNYEQNIPVLVDPHGFVNSRWDPHWGSEAQGYADTYNMNDGKAEEFRTCPYCRSGCSWCK